MKKLNKSISIIFLISAIIYGCNNDNSENRETSQTPEKNSKYSLNINNACGFNTQIKENKVYTFNSDIEADLAVSKIMKLTGLPPNFTIKAANVDNVAATIICVDSTTCIRYILYNQEFMQLVKDNTKTHFSEMSILAHEIGHHLSGHTLSSSGNSHDQELEADNFSGFILFKMGASLDEAQSAVNKLCSESGSMTHPPKSARIAAIANGWYLAKSSSTNTTYSEIKSNSANTTYNSVTENNSSSNHSNTITAIKRFIEKYSFPLTNSEASCKINYNSNTRTLTIDGYRLRLNSIHIHYENKLGYDCASFECSFGENCIKDPDGILIDAFSIPLPNRQKCNEFISLVEEL